MQFSRVAVQLFTISLSQVVSAVYRLFTALLFFSCFPSIVERGERAASELDALLADFLVLFCVAKQRRCEQSSAVSPVQLVASLLLAHQLHGSSKFG